MTSALNTTIMVVSDDTRLEPDTEDSVIDSVTEEEVKTEISELSRYGQILMLFMIEENNLHSSGCRS